MTLGSKENKKKSSNFNTTIIKICPSFHQYKKFKFELITKRDGNYFTIKSMNISMFILFSHFSLVITFSLFRECTVSFCYWYIFVVIPCWTQSNCLLNPGRSSFLLETPFKSGLQLFFTRTASQMLRRQLQFVKNVFLNLYRLLILLISIVYIYAIQQKYKFEMILF